MPLCTSFVVGVILATPFATNVYYVESNRALLEPSEAVKSLAPFASIRNTSNEVKTIVSKGLTGSPACRTTSSESSGDLLSESLP